MVKFRSVGTDGLCLWRARVAGLGSHALLGLNINDASHRSCFYTHRLHKDSIQDISFSCDESYVATLGSKDANDVVVWDVRSASPICGAPVRGGPALCIRFFNKSERQFLTGQTRCL